MIAIFVKTSWERRGTRLVSFYSHVAGISGTFPGADEPLYVNTHTVVLRNAGREPATNVRLHHANLPLFSFFPLSVPHQVEAMPRGRQDIVIPKLIPGEQVTISYLYFPPMTFDQVNDGIKCDQGFAHAIPVLPRRIYPFWAIFINQFFFYFGIMAVTFLLFRFGAWLYTLAR